MYKRIKHFVSGSELRNQILRGISGAAAINILSIFFSLALGILLARTLGPAQYGIYITVHSIIAIIGLPTKAGLPSLIVRETAKYQLRENWSYLRGLLTLSNLSVFVFSAIVALIVII